MNEMRDESEALKKLFDMEQELGINGQDRFHNSEEGKKKYEELFENHPSCKDVKSEETIEELATKLARYKRGNFSSKTKVIVDIDGTIAKIGDRIKYIQREKKDWDSFYKHCEEDEPIIEIAALVQSLFEECYEIIFCTGRSEKYRTETINWLKAYFSKPLIAQSSLLMRPENDFRHDTIVKPLLLNDANINLNEISFILEDRDSMVKKWRELGLICLQVADGDF